MRLINADSLKENLSEWLKQVDPTHPSDIPPMEDIIVSTIMTVEEEPTVDAVPVRHGKWIRNDNGTYSCSECHSWIPNEQHYYARYCLFCGAKMDGERD